MSQRVDSQSCCSWQNVAVCITGAAAISSIAIGVLSLLGVHYDLQLFKLEDLTKMTAGGMAIGGSVTFIALVGGKIYFQCRTTEVIDDIVLPSDEPRSVAPPTISPPTEIQLQTVKDRILVEQFVTVTDEQVEAIETSFKNMPLAGRRVLIYKVSTQIVVCKVDDNFDPPFSRARFIKEGTGYRNITGTLNPDESTLLRYLDLHRSDDPQRWKYYEPQDPNSTPAAPPPPLPQPLADIEVVAKDVLLSQIQRDDFRTLTREQAQRMRLGGNQVAIYREQGTGDIIFQTNDFASGRVNPINRFVKDGTVYKTTGDEPRFTLAGYMSVWEELCGTIEYYQPKA